MSDNTATVGYVNELIESLNDRYETAFEDESDFWSVEWFADLSRAVLRNADSFERIMSTNKLIGYLEGLCDEHDQPWRDE